MEVNGVHQLFDYSHPSKYLLLCLVKDRNSHRFGTTRNEMVLSEVQRRQWEDNGQSIRKVEKRQIVQQVVRRVPGCHVMFFYSGV